MAQKEITFNYIKSGDFKTAHADGIVGGITPKNNVYMAFFTERPSIPQKVIYELKEDGSLGKSIKSEGKEGLVREMVCEVVVDTETAVRIRDWLTRQIDGIETKQRP